MCRSRSARPDEIFIPNAPKTVPPQSKQPQSVAIARCRDTAPGYRGIAPLCLRQDNREPGLGFASAWRPRDLRRLGLGDLILVDSSRHLAAMLRTHKSTKPLKGCLGRLSAMHQIHKVLGVRPVLSRDVVLKQTSVWGFEFRVLKTFRLAASGTVIGNHQDRGRYDVRNPTTGTCSLPILYTCSCAISIVCHKKGRRESSP